MPLCAASTRRCAGERELVLGLTEHVAILSWGGAARQGVNRQRWHAFGPRIHLERCDDEWRGSVAFIAVGFLGTRGLLGCRHLVERKHGHQMLEAGEFFARRAADALDGRFGHNEAGKLLFQLLQLAEKLDVFVVGDELPAFDVIGVVVPLDFSGQLGMAFFGFRFSVCHGGIMGTERRKGNYF